MRSKIFINYRRDNSSWNSVALYQELIKYFPKENIFKDFSTIEPGADFVESIEEALKSCDVLLVLISEHWLETKDKNGNIRINNPDDFVRVEIATALKRNVIVIPILFDNAVLPPAEELPDDLKKLARRQYIEIDKTRFEADTEKLASTIKNILDKKEIGSDTPVNPIVIDPIEPNPPTNPVEILKPKPNYKKWLAPIGIGIAILAFFAIFLYIWKANALKDARIADSLNMLNERIRLDKQQAEIDSIAKAYAATKRRSIQGSSATANTQGSASPKDQGESQANSGKPPLPFGTYENFPAAYRAVFKEAGSNFINIKGDPFPNNTESIQNYKPKIVIMDNSAVASNIFPRNNEWAFRFVIDGTQETDPSKSQEIDALIQTVYKENGLEFKTTQLTSGRSDMRPSYEYASGPYRVDFYRWLIGGRYSYEVIIYHRTN